MIGDKVCSKLALKGVTAYFSVGKIASVIDMKSKKLNTYSPTAKLPDLQFQVKTVEATVTGDTLHVNHEWSFSVMA